MRLRLPPSLAQRDIVLVQFAGRCGASRARALASIAVTARSAAWPTCSSPQFVVAVAVVQKQLIPLCQVFACVFACEVEVASFALPLIDRPSLPPAPFSLATSVGPAAGPLFIVIETVHSLAGATYCVSTRAFTSWLSNINCPAAASFYHSTPHNFGGRCQNCHLHSNSTTTTQHAAPAICG